MHQQGLAIPLRSVARVNLGNYAINKEENPMRNEIPKWGWFNGLFLFEYEDALENNKDITIGEFYNNFRNNHLNNKEFPLKNQGIAISSLYMLLVFPREIWEREQNEGTQFQFNTKSLFEFENGNNLSNWDFIRLMRNSISHANFDMKSDGEYIFWNRKDNDDINFKVKILHSNLFKFITEIGKYYLNKVGAQHCL
jgi:hypothetical protein